MKVPKVFIPEKDQKNNVKRLLEEPKIENSFALDDLLDTYEDIRERGNHLHMISGFGQLYSICEKSVKTLTYKKEDIEELSEKIISKKQTHRHNLGVYLSALVNNIIKEGDVITLNPKIELDCLCSFLEKGTAVIKGNTGWYFGTCMRGGTAIVDGNTDYSTGCMMAGGEILVFGEAGTIYSKHKGKIYVNGELMKPT